MQSEHYTITTLSHSSQTALSSNGNSNRFDANKSTKGASKLRRDLINAEIANLRDLLPLPPSTRQRLSQLQLMALVCVYVRKANYFQQAFKRHDSISLQTPTPNIGFSKALNGFLMMMTQNGKLLYISDNAAEYLGHSMEDLLIHGDSVYDIIDKQDHQAIQVELGRTPGSTQNSHDDTRIFLCRMNVSRNARRQMRFGDQKVVLIQGHYLSFLPLCSRNEPVFLATCTPIAMPETRECVVQGATNVFTSIHSMDMKFIHIDKNGEFHLGYPRSEVQNASWYRLLHWDCLREAQIKHRLITQSEQDRSCILLVRLQRRTGDWLWVHCVLQVKENMENSQQPVIVCTNQVLSEQEASVMQANNWLYHYYMVQSKLQYGLAYDTNTSSRMVSYYQTPVHQPHATITMPSFVQHHESSISSANDTVHHVNDRIGYTHSPGPTSGHLHTGHHHGHLSEGVTQQRPNLQTFTTDRPMSIDAEPVDYSIHHSVHMKKQRTSENYQQLRSSPIQSYKKESKYTQESSEMEMMKMSESVDSPPEEVIVDLDTVQTTACTGDGGLLCMMPTMLTTTMQHSVNKPRLMLKMGTSDPAEFMEQWNPSPPWSDTLQKVPDIMHHDLSPYVTTTPPTPTGTPGESNSSSHMAFTFDWMPEQFVPNLTGPPIKQIPLNEEDHYHNEPCWSSENHRVFILQPPPRGNITEISIEHSNNSPKNQQNSPPLTPSSEQTSCDTTTTGSCIDSC